MLGWLLGKEKPERRRSNIEVCSEIASLFAVFIEAQGYDQLLRSDCWLTFRQFEGARFSITHARHFREVMGTIKVQLSELSSYYELKRAHKTLSELGDAPDIVEALEYRIVQPLLDRLAYEAYDSIKDLARYPANKPTSQEVYFSAQIDALAHAYNIGEDDDEDSSKKADRLGSQLMVCEKGTRNSFHPVDLLDPQSQYGKFFALLTLSSDLSEISAVAVEDDSNQEMFVHGISNAVEEAARSGEDMTLSQAVSAGWSAIDWLIDTED